MREDFIRNQATSQSPRMKSKEASPTAAEKALEQGKRIELLEKDVGDFMNEDMVLPEKETVKAQSNAFKLVLKEYSGADATLEEIMWMLNTAKKLPKLEKGGHIDQMLLDEERSKAFNGQLGDFFSLKGKELQHDAKVRIIRMLLALFRPPISEAETQTDGGSLESKIQELQLLLRDAFN